jgi:hypothetical protein
MEVCLAAIKQQIYEYTEMGDNCLRSDESCKFVKQRNHTLIMINTFQLNSGIYSFKRQNSTSRKYVFHIFGKNFILSSLSLLVWYGHQLQEIL